MKHIFTVIAIAGILAVGLAVTSVAAQTPQYQTPTPGMFPMVTMTAVPQQQMTPAVSSQQQWGMGRRGGMMGGRMGGRMGMRGGMMGNVQINAGPGMMQGDWSSSNSGASTMTNGTMMYVAPMHDDAARYMGMTSQDYANQMTAGKTMAQIAAEKGYTEQQLMDAIMNGRKSASSQAVQSGHMTQAQADAMLQYMNDNLKSMVNTPGYGYGSGYGWGSGNMLWETQPQANPQQGNTNGWDGWGMMWGVPVTATPLAVP